MSICPCGYWWADLDEDGTPISLEYCHYEGPAEWEPCEQETYDEYADEARIEEEELKNPRGRRMLMNMLKLGNSFAIDMNRRNLWISWRTYI